NRSAILVGDLPFALRRHLRTRRLQAALAVRAPAGRRVHRRLRGGSGEPVGGGHGGRRGGDDRRTHPRGGRLRHTSRRVLRGDERGARPPRVLLYLRRGQDGLGPYRRTLMWLP